MQSAYRQLAQTLRENIISGKWPAGHKLETERELCGRYGLSRITVRQALRILEEENLVARNQGLGTFINEPVRRKIPIVQGNFARSVAEHAPDRQRLLIEKRRSQAGGELCRQFNILSSEIVLRVRRLDLIGRQPAAVDEVIMPLRYADRLNDADWLDFEFLECWQERQGMVLNYESQTIEAAPATGWQRKWLKIKGGHPLLLETNLVHLADGQVAAKFTSYYRHEYYMFKSVDRSIGKHDRRASRSARGVAELKEMTRDD